MRRRRFFQGLLAGAATVSVLGRARAWFTDAREILPLIAPLSVGDEVGLGWRLEALSGVDAGAVALTLRKGTRFARVHVCRRGDGQRGVAASSSLDLFLMNDGDGRLPTDESLARAVTELARRVRENESEGARLPSGLMSHAERCQAYASCGKLT
ncbi:MAG: hypothetical protein R3B13_35875 [Polyangiaceae bacterium]